MNSFAVLSQHIGDTPRRPAGARRLRPSNADGFAMVAVMVLLLLAFTLAAAAKFYTVLDLKSTQHYSTGNQAFAAAEAGLLDVINTIDTRGVINFQNEIVNSNLIPVSTTPTTFSGFSNVSYQVTGWSSVSATGGTVTIQGNAPLSALRTLKVALTRGGFTAGPGALHLSNDTASGGLSGTSFLVDGNNHTVTTDASGNVTGVTLDTSGTVPARPAISTRNDTVTSSIVNGLSSGQIPDLQGLGYNSSTSTPSVETTSSASTADILRMVQDILSNNGASSGCGTGNNNNKVGNVQCIGKQNVGSGGQGTNAISLGTAASPQITELTNSNAKIAGGSTGFGILIVDQNVAFNGNFTFYGWVLFKNPDSNGITVGGSVNLNGTVWSPLPAFSGNGNIAIDYCKDCLSSYADPAGSGTNLPRPIQIASWSES
jgi:hypothetical protein